MAKKKTKKRSSLRFVVIESKGYGNRLKNLKVYYEGARPKGLRDDGAFKFGKNILEILQDKYGKNFKIILTKDTDEVLKDGKIFVVKISSKTLTKINGELLNRTRDIKLGIINTQFSKTHPSLVSSKLDQVYTANKLSGILDKKIIPKLSAADKDALDAFLLEYISANPSTPALIKLNAKAQLKTLKQFATDLKSEIPKKHSESWWQDYIKKNILVIQQGYINSIDKFNAGIGNVKYPDFLLITHDNYLDILEIKKPDTKMLSHDEGRDNYYFDRELSKATIQTENYINLIYSNGPSVRNFIQDKHGIQLHIIRPRGIILAGSSNELKNQKMRDDFRTLTQSMKNIVFITYDELLVRLENYISVLEHHGGGSLKKKVKKKK